MAEWYEGTHDWKGGDSFSGYLANIFKEVLAAYDLSAREALLNADEKTPTVTIALAQRLQEDRQPQLLSALLELAHRLPAGSEAGRGRRQRARRNCSEGSGRKPLCLSG